MTFTTIRTAPIPVGAKKQWVSLETHPDGGFEWWVGLPDPPTSCRWDDRDDNALWEVMIACLRAAAKTPAGDWGYASRYYADLEKIETVGKPFWYGSLNFDCFPDVSSKDFHPSHGIKCDDDVAWWSPFRDAYLFVALWKARKKNAEGLMRQVAKAAVASVSIEDYGNITDYFRAVATASSATFEQGSLPLIKQYTSLGAKFVTVQFNGVVTSLPIEELRVPTRIQDALGLDLELPMRRFRDEIIQEVLLTGVASVSTDLGVVNILTKSENAWDYC